MKKFIMLFTIVLLSYSGFSSAQQNNDDENFNVSRLILAKNRIKYIEQNLPMTEELSKLFWPIYKDYQSQVKTINERVIVLIKVYADNYNQDAITNEKASLLMADFMEVDKQRLALKAKYIKIFSAKLPAKLVWRYFHIESNLDTMINNSYISQIPMVNL